ncbi:hypothetical protein Tco_0247154 [Tanacetum coccineum]
MANENVSAPAPTRSDDQILLFAAWVPIRKSNFVLDLQKNPIFQISVDILTGAYHFQLDEGWFILDENLLMEALEITLVDQAHQFVSPPSGDAIMDFVNQLGYLREIYFVSRMAVNNLYQPWRAILSMINTCLTGKTSGFDRPRYPVLQMLWAMQTFLTDKANLSIAPQKGKKTKPHVIPYCRFTKLIICHLGRTHNIHQRSVSPLHLAEEDHRLRNLKFVPKGEEDEDDASANIVCDSPSPADAETGANTDITTSTANTEVLYVEDVQGEKILHTVVLKEKTFKLDEGQAGSDPGKTPESRPPPKHEHMDEDQAGPNPG